MNSPDHARSLVRESGGAELLERLDHLDARRAAPREVGHPPRAPERGSVVDYDVIIAGAGLWSLLAPLLAKRGLRVAVLDRARAGQSHREWNASGPELLALVHAGVVDETTLGRLVVARYDLGICRFANGGTYPVMGVLDHAVDAGGLLAHGRSLSQAHGVAILDRHAVLSHASGPDAVRVRMRAADGESEITARLLVDARGAASPYATADLACPTVGGVVTGLAVGDAANEINPRHGEILATVDGVVEGRQHVWEAFPGRPNETTVYLFYYGRASEPMSLAQLYARFFATLPAYKRGQTCLIRPTFGFIPGWSRLTRPPAAPDRRVVLVGDAAARHSPLTCCGFGATLRSLMGAADAIAGATRTADPSLATPPCVVDDSPAHELTGVLARMLAARTFKGNELNDLLDVAFATLHEMGGDLYGQLLRDEIAPRQVVNFLQMTASRHPAVWMHVVRSLGPLVASRWALRVARQCV